LLIIIVVFYIFLCDICFTHQVSGKGKEIENTMLWKDEVNATIGVIEHILDGYLWKYYYLHNIINLLTTQPILQVSNRICQQI